MSFAFFAFASKSSEVKPVAKHGPTKDETAAPHQDEIRKYLRMIPEVAEPNLARVWEIKEEIREGRYPTREMIEETAARLALRFLRKE